MIAGSVGVRRKNDGALSVTRVTELKSYPKGRQSTCLSYWNSEFDYKKKLAATVKLCGKSDCIPAPCRALTRKMDFAFE